MGVTLIPIMHLSEFKRIRENGYETVDHIPVIIFCCSLTEERKDAFFTYNGSCNGFRKIIEVFHRDSRIKRDSP
ncbi:hypothetical protein GCM10007162_15980 [Ignatzschineria ureiclastica]|nr:hypothetical protein GCM10007162_15980 [Ignatzschineria ureiclastica]